MSSMETIVPPPTAAPFVKRKLSYLEYFHACSGQAKNSLERPRENALILEGEGMIDPAALAAAVDRAVAVNPAVALKLVGKRSRACWVPEGSNPAIRVVKESTWTGRSQAGSEFIHATKLSQEDGVTCEFILVEGTKNFVVFRSLHAIMDGIGTMHFLADVFNALNHRPLTGTNTTIGDTELMRSVNSSRHKVDMSKKIARATGKSRGDEKGDSWQRFSLAGPQLFLLPRIAIAIAEFARNHSGERILISVPVNMRRHRPAMHSTLNYTCIAYVDVEPTDDASKFQKKLHKQLQKNSEAFYMRAFEYVRYLPFSWLDKILHRTEKNYRNSAILETAMVSDMGLFDPGRFSGAGFTATELFGVPIPGLTYCLITTMGKAINITLGMPAIYANNGRMEQLVGHIKNKLTT